VDLLDWHRGRLSSRRLAVLVKHLPREGAVSRELHGEAAEWAVTDHLMAAAVDHLAAANWMFARVNTDEDHEQPGPPTPVPRPGDEPAPGYGAVDAAGDTGADRRPPGTGTPAAPSPTRLAQFFT
jgi:hypothetical protein